MSRTHLWRGQWLDDAALARLIPGLRQEVNEALAATLPLPVLLDAAQGLHEQLESRRRLFFDLTACLEAAGLSSEEAEATLDLLTASLARPCLEERRVRGLGTDDAMAVPRVSWNDSLFTGWAPLGLLVMVAPRQPLWVGIEAALDALLAGNVCFLRSWPGDWLFSQRFLQALADCDPTGLVRSFVYVACFTDDEMEPLRSILALADGVAAWGDPRTLRQIRHLAPCGVPLIEHPACLSVAWVARDKMDALAALERVAQECCRWEQRAAWSPQIVYVDTEDADDIESFAVLFGSVMNDASTAAPLSYPDLFDQAAITTLTECWKLDATVQERMGLIEGNDASWRLLVDADPEPSATPLFRTVRIKPLPEDHIVETLRPFGRSLHAVSLVCSPSGYARLARLFATAGARHVTPPQRLSVPLPFSSTGDAVCLARYTRAITVVGGEDYRGLTALSELWGTALLESDPASPACSRPAVWSDPQQDARAEAQARARALVAAGLDPTRDRCLLLPSGDPWDSEEASVRAALDHLGLTWTWPREGVGPRPLARLLHGGVDALIGTVEALMDFVDMLPSADDAPSIRKIFHIGAEPGDGCRILLEQWLGAAHVRSAGYWRPEAGLLGFACPHSPPGVYHLQSGGWTVHAGVADHERVFGEATAGRLVFASADGDIRVETHDSGQCLFGTCACGRTGERFAVTERGDEYAGEEYVQEDLPEEEPEDY